MSSAPFNAQTKVALVSYGGLALDVLPA